jgi:hypothetical protein
MAQLGGRFRLRRVLAVVGSLAVHLGMAAVLLWPHRLAPDLPTTAVEVTLWPAERSEREPPVIRPRAKKPGPPTTDSALGSPLPEPSPAMPSEAVAEASPVPPQADRQAIPIDCGSPLLGRIERARCVEDGRSAKFARRGNAEYPEFAFDPVKQGVFDQRARHNEECRRYKEQPTPSGRSTSEGALFPGMGIVPKLSEGACL